MLEAGEELTLLPLARELKTVFLIYEDMKSINNNNKRYEV